MRSHRPRVSSGNRVGGQPDPHTLPRKQTAGPAPDGSPPPPAFVPAAALGHLQMLLRIAPRHRWGNGRMVTVPTARAAMKCPVLCLAHSKRQINANLFIILLLTTITVTHTCLPGRPWLRWLRAPTSCTTGHSAPQLQLAS